jgi:hypothetical protein
MGCWFRQTYSEATGEQSLKRNRAIEAFRSAGETIGPIEHGMSLFAVTRGQFSMIDMI